MYYKLLNPKLETIVSKIILVLMHTCINFNKMIDFINVCKNIITVILNVTDVLIDILICIIMQFSRKYS